ncbi:MAG: hydrogenase expression/formation protein HypD [Anaerolineaceae bacterium]|nr:MAG: hydrogenase expression/formation protein HypD [Anaerolineaceae bacterium]
MKYLDEYRDADLTRKLLADLQKTITRPWTLMEVCGGQTHSIIRSGLDRMLPREISLVHGPGCPVCVTPLELVDKAVALASRPDVIFTSYGDMLRVPGSDRDLFAVKAAGGDVRIVYSPLDALEVARKNPEKTVVFFAIGFETTAPANAMAVLQAKAQGLANFAALVSHVVVPAAITALMESADVKIDGFLAAGHVCTVMGFWEYEPLAEKYKIPIVVTGFEPIDLLHGILDCVRELEAGRYGVRNAYARSVTRDGNRSAQAVIQKVFETTDRAWRGIGVIPMSGYRLREEFAAFDAELRFPEIQSIETHESPLCISGLVLQGRKKPDECPAFGKECTPQTPLGATMVSSEGACAAYYRYGRYEKETNREGR